MFEHDGTLLGLGGDPEYELEWCRPIGETGSEHSFSYIAEGLSSLHDKCLENLATKLWMPAVRVDRHCKYNFLLSNGEYLFAYMNGETHSIICLDIHLTEEL